MLGTWRWAILDAVLHDSLSCDSKQRTSGNDFKTTAAECSSDSGASLHPTHSRASERTRVGSRPHAAFISPLPVTQQVAERGSSRKQRSKSHGEIQTVASQRPACPLVKPAIKRLFRHHIAARGEKPEGGTKPRSTFSS